MADPENRHSVHADPLRREPTAIVAIDDDPRFLSATAQVLAAAGMVCHTVATGEAGLRLIREHEPDLVLLGSLRNGEDAFQLCREIRRTWSPEELPVILLAAPETLESMTAACESGADDFLARPLHWPHLPYRIRQVLRGSRDHAERRQAEAALRLRTLEVDRLNRLYAALNQINRAVLASPVPQALLDKICEAMVEQGPFSAAWIGWNDPLTHEVHVEAACGDRSGYFAGNQVRSDDSPQGQGPAGRAIREGRTCVANDFPGSIGASAWRDAVVRSGYGSCAAIPIRKGGEARGALVVYASEMNCFGAQELALLEGVAENLAFALGHFEVDTQRKRAEAALLEREERYRTFFEYGPDGIVLLDPASARPIEFNDQACRQLGYTRDEFQALSMADIEVVESVEDTAQRIQGVLETGVADFETRQRTRSGEVRDVHVTAQNIRVGDQSVYHCVWRDITDRKQAEDALRASEAEYRRLVWDMQVGVLLQGPRTEILLSNPKALELLGMSEDQLRGKTSLDPAWNVIHEDGSPFPGPTHPVPQAIATGRAVRNIIMGVYHPVRKNRVWLSVDAEPQFQADGTVRQVLCTFIDITELKQTEDALRESEARFKALHNASFGGISIHDKGIILECNQGLSLMTGYSRNELIGMNGLMLIAPECRDFVMDKILSGYEKAYESFGVRKNGEIYPMQLEGRNILYQGRTVRTVEFRDITERKQAEAENTKLQVQLQQSQKMESLGLLAGGVAHDINNVSGAILGMATAHIAAQPVESPAYRAFETISQAAVRGGRMVKSLLNFARQNPAEELQLDVNTILQEEVRLLERTTLSKIQLEMNLADHLRPILGDASALSHAFMNLCVNAVDAMPDSGRLTLRTGNVDNDWIEVVVEDTGTGMPAEVLAKAMDPFFSTKGVGKGTGLGLSMVYSTVKAHHGQLEIQSEPGQGTRVRMRFPACEPMAQAQGPIAEPGSQASPGGVRVLLVDDDELMRVSIQAILEILGHVVTAAVSGEDALEIMATGFQPDVVILDMNMPGLGGAGTLPRLRALLPEVPVLLTTGYIDRTARDLASVHPGVALLSKPFSIKELKQHLEGLGTGSSGPMA